MRVNIHDFKEQLVQRMPSIVAAYFPNARRTGKGWRMGDILGNKGSSCWIGDNGIWKDHANPDDRGDVLSLLQRRLNLGFKELVVEMTREFGLSLQNDEPVRTQFPKKQLEPLTAEAKAYLESRGISGEFCATLPVFSVQNEPVIAFIHEDEHGGVGMVKYCAYDKKAFWAEDSPASVMFPIPYVLEHFPDSDFVVICEGQWDCLSLLQYGIPALTVPNGTGDMDFVKHQWNLIHSFEHIHLAFDPDQAGKEAAAKLAPRLENAPLMVDLPDGMDVNQFVREKGIEEFKELLEKAAPYSPPQIIHAPVYTKAAITYNENDIPSDDLPWNCPFGLRPSEYTVYVARTHHGKSNLVRQILSNLAQNNVSVAVASFEEGHIPYTSMFLRHVFGGHADEEHAGRLLENLYFADGNDGTQKRVRLADLLDRFSYLYKRYGCTHALIDNIACIDISRDSLANQADAANEIRQWCLAHPVHIHVVAHPRKPSQDAKDATPTTYDIRGAAEIAEFSWNIISLWRNVQKEQQLELLRQQGAEPQQLKSYWVENPCSRILCEKQRTTGVVWGRDLWYRRDIRGFVDSPI